MTCSYSNVTGNLNLRNSKETLMTDRWTEIRVYTAEY